MATHCYVASYARRGRNDKIIGAWSDVRNAMIGVERHSLAAAFTTDAPVRWLDQHGIESVERTLDDGHDVIAVARTVGSDYPYLHYIVTKIPTDD